MDKKKLFIYGIGRLAEYAFYVFENDTDYNVEGYCMESKHLLDNKNPLEARVFEEIEDLLLEEGYFVFIAIGNNLIRERIYNRFNEKGFKMATYISTKASFWPNLEVGDNCFIGEGSVIQPFVKIGANSILFGARLGHHTTVGNHVLLSGPTIGGNVTIGDHSFIGLNAVVLQHLKIGPKNIIGMGVALKSSTHEGEVYSAASFKKRTVSFDDISNNYL